MARYVAGVVAQYIAGKNILAIIALTTAHRYQKQIGMLGNRSGDFRRHDLDLDAERACPFVALHKVLDLNGAGRRLADSLETACPGALGWDQANMPDQGDGLVGQALYRPQGCRAVDRIRSGLQHPE